MLHLPSVITILLQASVLLALQDKRLMQMQHASLTPITFVTVKDEYFDNNLGKSQLWLNRESLPHEWIVLYNAENKYISQLYADAKEQSQHELVIFLHSDVFLPASFYEELMQRLALLDSIDANWGALGAVGITVTEHVVLNLTDVGGTHSSAVDFWTEPAQAFDECLLILRKSSGVNFDRNLPGFDMYGMDIVQESKANNMTAYVLPVNIHHKEFDAEGRAYSDQRFLEKVLTNAYYDRASNTALYMLSKWCDSGMGCVHGTFFRLNCLDWTMTLGLGFMPDYAHPEAAWTPLVPSTPISEKCEESRKHPESVSARKELNTIFMR